MKLKITSIILTTLILLSFHIQNSYCQTHQPYYWAYGFVVPTSGRQLPYWRFYSPYDPFSDYHIPRYLKIISISYDNVAIADIIGSEQVDSGIKKPDGYIDMDDVGFVCLRFGKKAWDDGWDFQADVDGDRDVDMNDIGIVTSNFGKRCSHIPFNPNMNLKVRYQWGEWTFDVTVPASGIVYTPPRTGWKPFTIYVLSNDIPVNAFILVDFQQVFPSWSDPSFTHGLDTDDPEGVWHPMLGDNGIIAYLIEWNSSEQSFTLGISAIGNIILGPCSGVSILNGKMNGGKCTSLKYPNSFYGSFGHANQLGEAIIYYQDIPPLYINIDAEYLERTPMIWPYDPFRPDRVTSGLVLMAWIDQFNDYDANISHSVDQFITIEPQWIHQTWHGLIIGWQDATFPPLEGSCYDDSSYHYQEQIPPKVNWQPGERLQFSLNMSAFIKRAFEYDWTNAYDIWYWYGLPEPQVLKNKSIIDVTDHIHIFAIHVYVECYYATIVVKFYEVSITNKPKYTVIGS